MQNSYKKTTKIAVFSALLSLFSITNSYSQNWAWAKSAGGFGQDAGSKTCTDASGNVFVAGNFSSASINIGTVTINNAGVTGSDGFIAKYNSSGVLLWAERIGGSGSESVSGICSDAAGRVYISGYFNSPLLSISPLTWGNGNAPTYDVFLVCIDGSGVPQWLQGFGNAGQEFAGGCAYSNSVSAVYITGTYFDPKLTIGTTTLNNTSATGKAEVFLMKFSSAGVLNWARSTGAGTSDDWGNAVAVDAAGFPCLGGTFSPSMVTGTTTIGATNLTSIGLQDMFIAKYTDIGNFQWAKGLGSSQGGDYFGGIEVDAANNIYFNGYYSTTSLIVGTSTLTNAGGYDAFVAKYNSAGTFQWANKLGGADMDYGYDCALDGNSNIYITGAYAGTVISVGTQTLANTTPGTSTDIYVAKYNSGGAIQWAYKAAGAGNEWGYGISADAVGNVYVTGFIDGLTSFGTYTAASAGGQDMFLSKISCLTASVTGLSNVCTGSTTTLTASGATTFSWSTGSTASSIVITPTASTTYSAIGYNGACSAPSNVFSVTLLPASVNAGPNLNLTCGQTQVIAATSNPVSPVSVTWTPATGLSSTSVLNPTLNPSPGTTQYTVNVALSNGCFAKNTLTVTEFAPKPDICMVSVDSLSKYNEIYWDETAYPMIDSMIVLREVSAGVYKRIGAVSKTALSYFVDTVQSIGPANGDPNITTYRYKIQMRDNCGNYSAPSFWHNTVFFTHTGGTFFWVNNYTIESATVPTNPVLTYSLMVCPNPSVSPTYTLVGITAGNQNTLNDPNYSAYSATADWRVEGDLGYQCTATLKTTAAKIGKSRSNIQNNKLFATGLNTNSLKTGVKVYPNPSQGILNIDFDSVNEDVEISLINVLGQTIYSDKNSKNISKKTIDVSAFAKGVYTLNLSGKAQYKVVIE